MGSGRILLVEDDPDIAFLVQRYLEQDGFSVSVCGDGREALASWRRHRPDLIVLDLMLPGLDGLEVCRRLRTETDVPVLMLTARADEVDKLVGLAIGADDYVTKPFAPREVVARVKAILRRAGRGAPSPDAEIILYRDLTIDPGRRRVKKGDEPVELTAREFDLLRTFVSQPGRVFTRSQLLNRIWGEDYPGAEHTVEVHISNLRRKLGDHPDAPAYLETVRGVGYRAPE